MSIQRPTGQKQFYSVDEFATLMRVSRMTVYRAIHDGEIVYVRLRRRYLIPARIVRDFISEPGRAQRA